jgi:hypothetical protein
MSTVEKIEELKQKLALLGESQNNKQVKYQ